MKGLTHLSFGIATSIATASIMSTMLSENQQIAFIAGSGLGAVLVDIDNAKTMIGENTKPFSTIIQNKFGHRMLVHSPLFLFAFFTFFWFLLNYCQSFYNIIGIILGLIALFFIGTVFINNFDKNKIIKSIFLFLLLPLSLLYVAYQSPEYVLYGVTFGWIGHLALDVLTKGGIPLLYPIKFKDKKSGKKRVKKFRLFFLKSCAWYECFIAMFLFILFFIVLISYYRHAQLLNCYNPIIVLGDLIPQKIEILKNIIFEKLGW